MSDFELLTEWKRLQSVQPKGVGLDRNGPAVIELIRFTLGNIERLTCLAEIGVAATLN